MEEQQSLEKVAGDPAKLQETGLVTIQEGGICVYPLNDFVIITTSPLSASAYTEPAITD